jgi:hypothetical protein
MGPLRDDYSAPGHAGVAWPGFPSVLECPECLTSCQGMAGTFHHVFRSQNTDYTPSMVRETNRVTPGSDNPTLGQVTPSRRRAHRAAARGVQDVGAGVGSIGYMAHNGCHQLAFFYHLSYEGCHSRVSDWLRGPYRLPSVGCVVHSTY